MSLSRTYSVKVPIKSYLKKYIHAKHGTDLPLNYRTTYGTLILCLLEKDYFSINMGKQKKEVRVSLITDEIEFTAPLNTMQYKGHSLTSDKVIAINRFFEDCFIEDLYRYCKDNKKNTAWRPGIDKAIYAFAEVYNIEVETDISFEALKKAEWRHRMKLEKKPPSFLPPTGGPVQMGYFGSFHQLAAS